MDVAPTAVTTAAATSPRFVFAATELMWLLPTVTINRVLFLLDTALHSAFHKSLSSIVRHTSHNISTDQAFC
jgi:hypothetical protein